MHTLDSIFIVIYIFIMITYHCNNMNHNSPKKRTCSERDPKGRRRDKKGESSPDGEPGKLDKVADNREETVMDRYLEVPVFSTAIPNPGSL